MSCPNCGGAKVSYRSWLTNNWQHSDFSLCADCGTLLTLGRGSTYTMTPPCQHCNGSRGIEERDVSGWGQSAYFCASCRRPVVSAGGGSGCVTIPLVGLGLSLAATCMHSLGYW